MPEFFPDQAGFCGQQRVRPVKLVLPNVEVRQDECCAVSDRRVQKIEPGAETRARNMNFYIYNN